MNIAIIMGRLTADPELRQTQSGIASCKFTIAVDRYSKDKEKKADFIRCIAWRQSAEFMTKYFSKGKMIAVTGSIQTDTYTDKEGNKRNTVQVLCDKVEFCGDKSSGNAGGNMQPAAFGDLGDFEEIIGASDEPPF